MPHGGHEPVTQGCLKRIVRGNKGRYYGGEHYDYQEDCWQPSESYTEPDFPDRNYPTGAAASTA